MRRIKTEIRGTSRARVYGELVTRVIGIHPHAREGPPTIILWPRHTGRPIIIPVDRTRFLWRRRIRQGEYTVKCQMTLSGRTSIAHVGLLKIRSGVNHTVLDVAGRLVHGRIEGLPPLFERAGRLSFTLDEDPGVKHEALLDTHNRFAFCGVTTGTYALRGEIKGHGIVRAQHVRVCSDDLDVGRLRIEARPYLRFQFQSPNGRPYRSNVHVQLWRTDLPSAMRAESGHRGRCEFRNEFTGDYRYRARSRHSKTATEGRLKLGREDRTVVVVRKRNGTT